MGKSFGINSKAQQGRERKQAQQEVQRRDEESRRDAKDALQWQTGAKTKSDKQVEEERRKDEKNRKRQEMEQLLAAEEAELAKLKTVKPIPTKKATTKGSISAGPSYLKVPSSEKSLGAFSSDSNKGSPMSEPAKHQVYNNAPEYSASNIEDAIFLLDSSSSVNVSSSKPIDRHPERRMHASYATFEERELGMLKKEYPTLRHTQLKEKLHKMWQKSPDNPFNQAHVSFNATRSQEFLQVTTDVESNLQRLRVSPSTQE